jgi:cytoskeletal protein CcmA (bactofilin family)
MAWLALAVIGLLAFVALPGWLLAADSRTGSDVTIEATETVTDDLYLAGGTINFLGRAQRDVSIAAGEATISGPIGGSLNLAAGRAEITGPISGSLRILGGTVTLTGNVGGDVVMTGGRLEVTSSARINGSILLAGAQLDMRGQVAGDINGLVGTSSIGGSVTGAVDLSTGNLTIANTARIDGPVTVTGKQEASVASGAEVPGGVTHNTVSPWGGDQSPLQSASGGLLRTLWMLVTGGLIVLVTPRLAQRLGRNGQQLIPAVPLGLLAMIALPIVAVALMATVIGFPAGLVVLVLLGVALYLTQAVAGMAIGRFILPRSWDDGSRGYLLLTTTLGIILIAVFRFLPLPWIWAIASAVVTMWGLGSMLMMIPQLGRQRSSTA